MTKFVTKRIYEPADARDGYRVLVDRLWPRGVSKERAELGEWAKDMAPSTELRKWFNHDPDKYAEFKTRYLKELRENPEASRVIAGWRRHEVVTLLYGARDQANNEAVALQHYLEE
ncbi:MAG: DUF488 family protein [Candidatus Eremiobacteraeota bacterium]|nr:DUF488 family protein [Candidatus Eremiobacteraeota bacterium]MCW5872008.1 DUF488 family protein [Candidatus Eremiobacteraeota bacterium]